MMNKLFTFFLTFIISLLFISCNKDDDNSENDSNTPSTPKEITVEQKQRALLLDFTATWCEACGPSIPFFQAAADEQKNNCIAIAVHTTNSELSPYYRIEGDDIVYRPGTFNLFKNSTGLNITGIPAFVVNQEKITNTANDFLRQKLVEKIDEYVGNDPTVNVGLDIIRLNNGVKVRTKTEFFKDASGSYYLALYLLDNAVEHRQNIGGSYKDDFVHSHTIRGIIGNGTPDQFFDYGELIATGSTVEGKTVEEDYEYSWDASLFELPSSLKDMEKWDSWDPNNYSIAAIIWKKSGSNYIFENGIMKNM